MLINNPNQSRSSHCTATFWRLSTSQSKQRGENNKKMKLECIKSTGAQYQWWRDCFHWTMAEFLAIPVDVVLMSRLTFFTVSSTHAVLPWWPCAACIFSRQHILNSEEAGIPAAYRQQVWGQGGLSKDVKSMEDSFMSFLWLCKQKDWNAGGRLSTCHRWRRYGPLKRILITGQR